MKEQLGRDVRAQTQTCIPEGPTTSKAPIIPDTKWMTLVKLSSPMLQEPSITNTRSALAPLQTKSWWVSKKQKELKILHIISQNELGLNDTQMPWT